jgi:hypothetical protein
MGAKDKTEGNLISISAKIVMSFVIHKDEGLSYKRELVWFSSCRPMFTSIIQNKTPAREHKRVAYINTNSLSLW